jgi:hypothetical protein
VWNTLRAPDAVVIHGDGSLPLDRYVEKIVALVVEYLWSPRPCLADQHVRAAASAAQRAVGHREVILHDVELS